MSEDKRQTWGLIIDVLDVLEKHGYHKADNLHTGQAVWLIGDLAHIYEGTKEEPAGPFLVPPLEPRQADPEQADHRTAQSAEAIAAARMPTILTALDEASDYKRDRAAGCADCPDQSCATCHHRLDAARAYDSLADQLQHARDATAADRPVCQADAGPPGNRVQPQAAQEKEAGQ
jgi:hypothetical protein